MLSLFKEEIIPYNENEILLLMKTKLSSALNKGNIPTWDELYQELPILEGPVYERTKAHFIELTKWTFLESIISKSYIEYFFHGPDDSQGIELSGNKVDIRINFTNEEWQLWLEVMAIKFKQNWNIKNPFCSFYGELNGAKFRFSLIHASTSPQKKSKLFLRSLSSKPHAISSFGANDDLINLIKNKKNILIAGSTGSGKTSLLNSCLDYINPSEHIVILEDTYEISTSQKFETRFLSGDTESTSLKSYLSYSLRLSPDRIILGEMRSHEVVPFLMAMNTGHKGLMGTIHASSAVDAIYRMALLFTLYAEKAGLEYPKVIELICRNLEFVIFMENKKIQQIIRILGSDKGVPFFEFYGSAN